MASQVFYRKWRPQVLAEVAGQEHVAQTLRNALTTHRVAHAYLFCGPRGTGKTSTGRILAKAVNCLTNGSGEPCNACTMCQVITEGRALDVVEIDAASNRGIDEIRELRERVNYAPSSARYKVYIIDEVHMLTEPAFNALLKTLEEPPAHVIFILATTEAHKVPATIMSRCQRFDFRRIPQSAVVARLEHVCQQEGIDFEPSALGLIARAATGSLRDAENLLEQLVTFYGTSVTTAQVRTVLGITGDERVRELVKHILNRDIAAGLSTINSVSEDGLDLRQFGRELVEYLRGLLLIKAGAEGAADLPTESVAQMKGLIASVPMGAIVRGIKLFGQMDMRSEEQATLPLELALVECALAEGLPAQVSEMAAPVPPPREEMPVVERASEAPVVAVDTPAPLAEGVEQLMLVWKRVIEASRVANKKRAVDALLRGCKPVAIEDSTVVLSCSPFVKGKLEMAENLVVAEEVISQVMGAPYKVRCVLAPPEKKPAPRPIKESPLVKAAIEMGARIVGSTEGE